MTKKDYELVADTLGKSNIAPQDKVEITKDLCEAFLQQNCRFNQDKFRQRVLTWVI